MTDLVQDVVSLLSMCTFIVSMAMWIGDVTNLLLPACREKRATR